MHLDSNRYRRQTPDAEPPDAEQFLAESFAIDKSYLSEFWVAVLAADAPYVIPEPSERFGQLGSHHLLLWKTSRPPFGPFEPPWFLYCMAYVISCRSAATEDEVLRAIDWLKRFVKRPRQFRRVETLARESGLLNAEWLKASIGSWFILAGAEIEKPRTEADLLEYFKELINRVFALREKQILKECPESAKLRKLQMLELDEKLDLDDGVLLQRSVRALAGLLLASGSAGRCDDPEKIAIVRDLIRKHTTPQEKKILALLAKGYNPAKTAQRLGVKPPTVRVQMARLKKKISNLL